MKEPGEIRRKMHSLMVTWVKRKEADRGTLKITKDDNAVFMITVRVLLMILIWENADAWNDAASDDNKNAEAKTDDDETDDDETVDDETVDADVPVDLAGLVDSNTALGEVGEGRGLQQQLLHVLHSHLGQIYREWNYSLTPANQQSLEWKLWENFIRSSRVLNWKWVVMFGELRLHLLG